MKKLLTILLISAMVLSLAACGEKSAESSTQTADASVTTAEEAAYSADTSEEEVKEDNYSEGEDFKLRVATHFNMFSGVNGVVETLIDYLENIKKATDEHVSGEVYFGGTLFGISETYEAVTQKMIDVGVISQKYLPDTDPLTEVVTLPLQGFDDNVKATKVLWNLVNEYPEILEQWEKDFKVLQLFVYPEMIVKYSEPGDVSENRGKATVYGICMNWDTWNSLPSEYQEAIDSLSGAESSVDFAEAVKRNAEASREIIVGDLQSFLEPSDEDYGQWQAACDEYASDWVESVTASTAVDGAALLARAKELYAQE